MPSSRVGELPLRRTRHALIALQGFLRESQVYDAVQETAKGPQTSIELLTSLEALAAAYVATFNPDHERWNSYPGSTRQAIQTLNLLNIRPFRPLMLAVANRFKEKEAADAFRMFISWGVRLLIASSTRSGSVEEPLANAAHKVQSGDIAHASALRKELSNIIPTDVQFKDAFAYARASKALLARYYLRSLEMAAKQEPTPWFIPNDDIGIINLEHVLPERPEGNWPQFDEDGVRLYSKRIGNLALLLAKSNSDLKSAAFTEKRAVYHKSPYELTRQIAKVDDWTAETITERQEGLAELALKAWPI